MFKKLFGVLVGLTFCGTCQAQLFSGPAFFNTAPSSQLGPVINNLVLANNPSGFVVSGQVLVTIPAAPVSGTLVSWVVDRPLNAAFGSATLQTTTVLSGFSAPPPGAVGNTGGIVQSGFTNVGGPSISTIQTSLLAGVDVPAWNNLSATSSTFNYTSGGVNFLRQQFFLDGIYFGGPGGIWTVDVPVFTFFSVVPEPGTILLPVVGLAGLAWSLRRRLVRPATT